MNSRQNANFANEEDKNPKNVLLTCNIAQDKPEHFWFLDSGCKITWLEILQCLPIWMKM